MTGGNAGIAAVGCATAWGRPGRMPRGSKGTVCAETVAVTVGTLTTATGVTPTLAGGVEATGGISDTAGVETGWETVDAGLAVRSGLAVRVGEACWLETSVTVVSVLAVLAAELLDVDLGGPAWAVTIEVSSDC